MAGDDVTAAFSKLMLSLDYPMVIVTTAAGGERSGCLVGFSTQVSVHPPRYLVGISNKNHTHGVITAAGHAGVHFPAADHLALAELFGGETGDEIDKFARCAWSEGPHGVPLLDDVSRRFAARIVDRIPVGDHLGVLLEPLSVDAGVRPQQGMTFHMVQQVDPGHDP